jgi:hypothetical protein
MKLNLKKIRINQLVVFVIAVILALYLIKSIRKSEDYEGDAGPSPSDKPEMPKISQNELNAVLKFIRN